MTEIEHVRGDTSHGPVAVFLDDAGKVGFVCRVDGAYWEGDMAQLTPPDSPQDPPLDEQERRVGAGGWTGATGVADRGTHLLTVAEARAVALRARR